MSKKNKTLENANKRLNEVDFFDLMQRYRIADISDQENVVNRFDAVKEWIRQNYANIRIKDIKITKYYKNAKRNE